MTINSLKTKEDKVAFLKALAEGKKSLSELKQLNLSALTTDELIRLKSLHKSINKTMVETWVDFINQIPLEDDRDFIRQVHSKIYN